MRDGTGGLEARMTQNELKNKMLEEWLKEENLVVNMCKLDDNIKMDLKDRGFDFSLNSSNITHE